MTTQTLKKELLNVNDGDSETLKMESEQNNECKLTIVKTIEPSRSLGFLSWEEINMTNRYLC